MWSTWIEILRCWMAEISQYSLKTFLSGLVSIFAVIVFINIPGLEVDQWEPAQSKWSYSDKQWFSPFRHHPLHRQLMLPPFKMSRSSALPQSLVAVSVSHAVAYVCMYVAAYAVAYTYVCMWRWVCAKCMPRTFCSCLSLVWSLVWHLSSVVTPLHNGTFCEDLWCCKFVCSCKQHKGRLKYEPLGARPFSMCVFNLSALSDSQCISWGTRWQPEIRTFSLTKDIPAC